MRVREGIYLFAAVCFLRRVSVSVLQEHRPTRSIIFAPMLFPSTIVGMAGGGGRAFPGQSSTGKPCQNLLKRANFSIAREVVQFTKSRLQVH